MEKALEGRGGPLQSHRALPCNTDDWLRMAAVPVGVKDASFRHMQGVHTWEDGERAGSGAAAAAVAGMTACGCGCGCDDCLGL